MLRLLLLLLRLLLLLLLPLLLLLLLLLFLTEFVVASFGVKSKLTPSFFSNPPPKTNPLFGPTPPPSLTLSCSSHTPSYTSHTMPAASQGDPHSKDPFSAAAAAAAAAARKEPPRKKKKTNLSL